MSNIEDKNYRIGRFSQDSPGISNMMSNLRTLAVFFLLLWWLTRRTWAPRSSSGGPDGPPAAGVRLPSSLDSGPYWQRHAATSGCWRRFHSSAPWYAEPARGSPLAAIRRGNDLVELFVFTSSARSVWPWQYSQRGDSGRVLQGETSKLKSHANMLTCCRLTNKNQSN